MRALLIEDDRMLAKMTQLVLAEDGFAVDVASTGEEGKLLASVNSYDVILLDLHLPDTNGLQVLQALRRDGNSTPIIIASGDGDDGDVVRGLDTGADDYVVKPVSRDVLKSRVRAAVRRGGATRTEQITMGDLVLNRLTREVRCNTRPLPLTPKEFSLLEHLMLHVEQVVTRSELLESVWDMNFDPGSNLIEVHMSRLRDKLRKEDAPVTVKTVRGAGFMLTARAS